MEYFRLHGNCFMVKGASKALIYDLFKNRTVGVSTNIAELYETELKIHPYQDVLERYASWKDQINKFTQHLIENDFAFFTDEPDSFPPMNIDFDLKKRIYSSVIELDSSLFKEYAKLFDNLLALDCSIFYIIIRDESIDLRALKKLLGIFKESRATWVQVIMDEVYFNFQELNEITHDMRINYKIYNAPKDEIVEGRWWLEESVYKFKLIEYSTSPFDLHANSQYGYEHFYPTQSTFTESQNHNPFFNLKLCISKNGEYKNDLSFSQSFGNFQTRSLQELLKDENFTKLWYLSNDKIEKCKDCQHRFQCVSNSNINELDGNYHKTNSCNYDPYTDTWHEINELELIKSKT